MALNEKLFLPKDIVCPVCETRFTRYELRKRQFNLDKRDIDYRPVYIGPINPRFFTIVVCPGCFYAAEDKYFCPLMTAEDLRKKELLDSHRSSWDAMSRVRAASSGQQIWKDAEAEKLRTLSPAQIAVLRQIKPLLERVSAKLASKGKPFNILQKEGDLETAIRAWELTAICAKVRRANHRLLGYTYLNAAWTARDAFELTQTAEDKEKFKAFEKAYLTEAVSFLTTANLATSIEDNFMPDGTKITKENLPENRVFEIMYILAGANRLLGNIEESNRFLSQIIMGGKGAQGIILWFVNQAKDMRHETALTNLPIPEDEPEDEDY